MTFLPIVVRELRVAARRPAAHRLRFLTAAGVMLLWFALSLGAQSSTRPAELGRHLFQALGVLGLGFTLLTGVFLTADCLSSEKREGTLGLLFLTDLRGYDVVLGKLGTTSLQALYGLLAALPMLALSVLMGGVTGGEVLRLAVVLLVTLLLSLAVGMAVSALAREAPQAMLATFLILFVVAGVPPTITSFFDGIRVVNFATNPLNWPSPVYAYILSADTAYRFGRGTVGYFGSILTLVTLSLAALAVACRRLPRDFEDHLTVPKTHAFAVPPVLAWPHRFQPMENPFQWLATRNRRLTTVANLTLLALLVPWLICLLMTFDRNLREFGFTVCMFGGYAMHLVAKIFLAVEASRRFSQDRASGTLEVLLVTPLSPANILRGQRAAFRGSAFGPVLICSFLNLALIWLLNGPNPMQMRGTDLRIFNGMFIGGIVVFLADTFALGWVGMETALRKPGLQRAVFATLRRVMLAPWIGIFLFVFLGIGGAFGRQETLALLSTLWFIASAILDLVTGFGARFRLDWNFRRFAAGEAIPTRPPFGEMPVAQPARVPL